MVNEKSLSRLGIVSAFAGVSCFLSFIQVACLYPGALGVPMSHGLAVVMAAISLVLSGLFASRFRESVPEANTPPVNASRPARFISRVFMLLAAAGLAWALWTWVELWQLAYRRPPYSWDGLYYHIPAINEWVLSRRVVWIDALPEVPFVNYPMAVELIGFFGHYLFKTSRLLDASNLWYWPLAFLALAVIAERIGARGIWRYFAGALVAGVPIFICQSLTSYVDIGFACSVMASIAAAVLMVFSKSRTNWPRAVLLGSCLGLAIGAKGTGLPFAFVIMTLTGIAGLWLQGYRYWRSQLRRLLLSGLVCLAVGGFWYIRSLVETGNPIYPIQVKLGEKVLLEGYDYNQFNQAALPVWLEKYPPLVRMFVSWFQFDAPVSGGDPVGGLGYVWPAGCLPALVFLIIVYFRGRSRAAYPGRELLLLLILGLALIILQPAAWWARFTVWLHALGLPCLAAAISLAAGRRPLDKRCFVVVFLGLAVSVGAMWESNITLNMERRRGQVPSPAGRPVQYQTSLDYLFPGLGEEQALASFFRARVLARSPMQGMGSLLVGILDLPVGEREIVVLPVPPRETDIEMLLKQGIEWVVWDVFDYGPVPDGLSKRATQTVVFAPEPELELHFIRL